MTVHTFKLPDIGEGIAEAELATWFVKIGDIVREDDIICEVTTDKATVEIPASVGGRVVWLGGEAGEVMAIGNDLIRIETDTEVDTPPAPVGAGMGERPDFGPSEPETDSAAQTTHVKPHSAAQRPAVNVRQRMDQGASGRPLAAPSVRGRAREMGIDLRLVRGTGPAGRILHEDLEDFARHGSEPPSRGGQARRAGTEEVRITGVRRKIAERMALSKSRIPHYSIIEEVDVEALEELREYLNRQFGDARGRLTLLPFVLRALADAICEFPEVNAHFDDEAGLVTRHRALHCGIATQTDNGLVVPVLRHAEGNGLWENAREIRRLSDAARERRAGPEELMGSTLTVTSLGRLGALATTPVINHPEVTIVGINKIAVRPLWNGATFAPRRMMNLSCSFDHRVVDGWNAAAFVARLKALLETPALLFMEWRDD